MKGEGRKKESEKGTGEARNEGEASKDNDEEVVMYCKMSQRMWIRHLVIIENLVAINSDVDEMEGTRMDGRPYHTCTVRHVVTQTSTHS